MKNGLHSQPTKVKKCRPNPNQYEKGKLIITCPLTKNKTGDKNEGAYKL